MHSLRILFFLFVLVCMIPSLSQAATRIINGETVGADSLLTGADTKLIEEAGPFNRYTDYPKGYMISYPKQMKTDVSLSAIRTVFADEKTQIEVYYDNFSNTDTTASDYIYYSRRFLENTRDHTVLADETFRQNGNRVHLLKWVRRPLSRVAVDRRYYATAEIVKNEQEVYTIFIKSTEPIHNEYQLIRSFQLIEPTGTAGIYLPLNQSKTPLNQETKKFFDTYFADNSPLRWGIFHQSAPEILRHVEEIEKRVNTRFPFLVRYQAMGDEVPISGLNIAYANQRYVELTMQTYYYDKDNTGVMYDILDGKYDAYLRQYAQDIKDFTHPVLFRLNNEMNGDWCWYSSFHASKDTDIYKSVWRYIRSIFDQTGVNNVLWVWNPHDRSFPNFAWNHHLTYYPGDDAVDIVGLTGYNTGDYFPGETWREFRDIYTPMYQEYTTVFNKPLMITEFGSNSFGGNKPAWISRMFEDMKRFERIKVAIWWSGVDLDKEGKAGRIYRMDENEKVLDAFQQGFSAEKPRAEK